MVSIAVLSNAFPGLLFASVAGGCVYAYHTSRNNEIDRQQKLDVFVLVSAKTIDNQVTSTELYKTVGKEQNKNYKCKLLLEFDCDVLREIEIDKGKKYIDFPGAESTSNNTNLDKAKLSKKDNLFLIKAKYLSVSSFFKNGNITPLSIVPITPETADDTKIFGEFNFLGAKADDSYVGNFTNVLAKVSSVSDGIDLNTDSFKCSSKNISEQGCQINKFTDDSQEIKISNSVIDSTALTSGSNSGSATDVSIATPSSPASGQAAQSQQNVQNPVTPQQSSVSNGDTLQPPQTAKKAPTTEESEVEKNKKEAEIKKQGKEQPYSKFNYVGSEQKLTNLPKKYEFNILKFEKEFSFSNWNTKAINLEKTETSKVENIKKISFNQLSPVIIFNNQLIIFK